MESNLVVNLKWLMERKNETGYSLNKAGIVSQSTLHHILVSGQSPRLSTLEPLAAHFNVSVSDLLARDLIGDTVRMRAAQHNAAGEPVEAEYFVEVPETTIELSAGNGRLHYEVDDEGNKASYRSDWFDKERLNPERCIRVRVKGNSMKPFLWSGDVVLINLDETEIIDDCVYALRIDDELFVKRLAKIAGVGIKVMSENPEYDTSILEAEKFDGRVQIIGRVRDKSGRGGL